MNPKKNLTKEDISILKEIIPVDLNNRADYFDSK